MAEPTSAAPAASSNTPAASSTPASTPASNEAPKTDITAAANAPADVSDAITPEEEAELASESGEKKPDESKAVKTKIKVDGQEVELTDDEIKKYASLGKAAQKRMQEAATIRKQHDKLQQDVNTFLEMLQKDPARVMSDLGMDPNKFAEELMNRQLAEAEKTPEQKEKEKLTKDLEEAQKRIKEVEEGKKKEEFEKMQNEYATKIERDISDAIDSNDMPKHPVMVRKVADLLMLAASKKIDLEARDVIGLAKKQVIDEFRALTGVLPEELLEEILGTDKVASLRRRYLKKLKATPTTPSSIKPTGQDVKQPDSKEKKLMKSSDFFKKLGSF